jgi:hypothetical protein
MVARLAPVQQDPPELLDKLDLLAQRVQLALWEQPE